jgi:hypothetical protein
MDKMGETESELVMNWLKRIELVIGKWMVDKDGWLVDGLLVDWKRIKNNQKRASASASCGSASDHRSDGHAKCETEWLVSDS